MSTIGQMPETHATGEQQSFLVRTRDAIESVSIVQREHRPLRQELPVSGDAFDGDNDDPFECSF